MENKKIFISYSWDNEEHKTWTKNLADRLEEIYEIEVAFDQYDLDSFTDKNYFMERGVFENDIVIVIITEGYIDKANNRFGGVGIETRLAVSRYWEESFGTGKSNIIPLLRSGDNMPNYLKDKFYLDFRIDDNFDVSFKNLLSHIKGTSRVRRPIKKYSIYNIPPHQDLTRIEDFLKINYKKRKLVFDKKDTTDFSNNNKIKFELWETRSPSINYYLFLFNNITIKNTINRLCQLIKRDNVKIKGLTVLKVGGSESGYLEKIFKENNLSVDLTELTYPDYIWEFCIDDRAKEEHGIYTSPNFIDQSLVTNDEYQNDLGPAFEYIRKQVKNQNQSIANVIIAPGGTGKTTLCSCLASYYQKSENVVVVFLQSEEIKKTAELVQKKKIETVYDLYESYASICINHDDEYVFDKVTFEVALLTGKLILIIDGLDELITLFPNGFDIDKFLQSIDELNKELASSKVILTSRNDVFSNQIVSKYENINKFKLIGFDVETCKRYLTKRFNKFNNSEFMIKKALSNINPLITKDENQRILPFIVDLLSTVVESSGFDETFDFKLSFDGKDYESNSDLTDYLVYSVFRRESVRQDIEIPIKDILDIFLELAVNHTDSFPKKDLEEIVNVFYTEKAEELSGKILRNPLISIDGEQCKFKYDFISDYFNTLNIINNINKSSSSEDFLKLVAKNAYGETNIFKDVTKYFQNKDFEDVICIVDNIVNKISKTIGKDDVFKPSDYKFKAISFFVNLIFHLKSSMSKENRAEIIKKIFGNNNSIHNFSIYGKSKPIDFTDLHVFNSKFVGYENFSSSKFNETKFSNCFFDGVYNEKLLADITPEMFDSCILGDLQTIIEQRQANLKENIILVEKEVRNFFTSFYHRGKFKDQKKSYIKFSNKVKNINNIFFDKLIKDGVIEVKVQKSDEIYYMVSAGFQTSVYSFLMNNTIDDDLRKVINLVV